MCVPRAIRLSLAAAAILCTVLPMWAEAQAAPARDPISARAAIEAGDPSNGPLASTFPLMMRTRSPLPDSMLPVVLGWPVLPREGRDTYWHDAQVAQKFSIFVVMDPRRRRTASAPGNRPRPVAALAEQLLPGRVPSIAAVPTTTPASKSPTPTRTRPRGQN